LNLKTQQVMQSIKRLGL